MQKQRIVIIGSGLAGLTAAYELSKSRRYEITVLEAGNSIGGRVRTLQIDGTNIEIGGFMIFSWYKYFHKILNELGMRRYLKPIKSYRQYIKREPTSKYIRANTIWYLGLLRLYLIMRLTIPALRNKVSIHEPDFGYFGNKSFQEYLEEWPLARKLISTSLNNIAMGYTYPDISKTPAATFVGFVFQLFYLRGNRNIKYLSGGTNRFVDTMAERCRQNGVRIWCNKEAISVTKGSVATGSDTVSADNIIFANGMQGDLLEKTLPDISLSSAERYTAYYVATIETDQKTSILKDSKWCIAYNFNRTVTMPSVTSVGNIGQIMDVDGRNILAFYISIPGGAEKLGDDEIRKLIDRHVQETCDFTVGYQILDIFYWGNTMPIVTPDLIARVQGAQGVNGYYFAGDYLCSPSMETAIYSGLKVARLIDKQYSIR